MGEQESGRNKKIISDLSIETMFEINPLDIGAGCAYVPFTDIIETNEFVVIEMELPGVKKEEMTIEVMEHYITVMGVKQHEERERDPSRRLRFHCMGRVFGKFKRTFEIPVPFNMREVRAELEKGLLTIRLPKLVDKRQKRIKIEIE